MNNGSTGGNGKTSPFGNGMGAPDRAAPSSSTDFTTNATGSGGGKGGSGEVERQLTNGGSTPQRPREGGNPKTAAGSPLPFDQPRSPQRDVGVGGQSNQKPPFKLR
jgi:hypothetical protein